MTLTQTTDAANADIMDANWRRIGTPTFDRALQECPNLVKPTRGYTNGTRDTIATGERGLQLDTTYRADNTIERARLTRNGEPLAYYRTRPNAPRVYRVSYDVYQWGWDAQR